MTIKILQLPREMPLGPALPKPVEVKVDPILAFERSEFQLPDAFADAKKTPGLWEQAPAPILKPGPTNGESVQRAPIQEEKPAKFNAGDKVLIFAGFGWQEMQGEVEGHVGSTDYYMVSFVDQAGNGGCRAFHAANLKLIPSPAQTDGEWHEHRGTACPVPQDTQVFIRWNDGAETGPYHARNVYGFDNGAVIAYKVLACKK